MNTQIKKYNVRRILMKSKIGRKVDFFCEPFKYLRLTFCLPRNENHFLLRTIEYNLPSENSYLFVSSIFLNCLDDPPELGLPVSSLPDRNLRWRPCWLNWDYYKAIINVHVKECFAVLFRNLVSFYRSVCNALKWSCLWVVSVLIGGQWNVHWTF